MTVKVLDAGGVERTISQIKIMDAGNVERTLAFVRILDAGGAVREVFTAGGGTGGGSDVSIVPAYKEMYGGKPSQRSAIFTADPAGQTVTAYSWGVVLGNGYVSGANNQASATLTVGPEETTFFCDMTIGGVVKRATCAFYFGYSGGGSNTLPSQ